MFSAMYAAMLSPWLSPLPSSCDETAAYTILAILIYNTINICLSICTRLTVQSYSYPILFNPLLLCWLLPTIAINNALMSALLMLPTFPWAELM